MNSKVPRWIEVREALRLEAPPLGEPGSVERLKQKIQEAYITMMVRPPTSVVGGVYVAERAKAGYQWESLAMHYFHGSYELPSSLVNPPTAFGQAVGRALLIDDESPLDERLGRCLEHPGAGGLSSVVALEVLWRSYLRYLDREDLRGAPERCLILKRELNEVELHRLSNMLFREARIGHYDELGFAANAAEFGRHLEEAKLQMDRLLDYTQKYPVHPLWLAEAMRGCLVQLNEDVQRAEVRAEQLAGFWKPTEREPRDLEAEKAAELLPPRHSMPFRELQKPKRRPAPVTEREHAENRAYWLVEAERASQEGAAEDVKLASGRSKNYDKTNLQVALSRVRKLIATGYARAPEPENEVHSRLKFLAQISLEIS